VTAAAVPGAKTLAALPILSIFTVLFGCSGDAAIVVLGALRLAYDRNSGGWSAPETLAHRLA
jgi:hypothetical protein